MHYYSARAEGALTKMVSSGQCILLKSGIELEHLGYDHESFSMLKAGANVEKMRPRGETMILYTRREALEGW